MNVEIWSDIACPWCYIGKRYFEAALAGFEHAEEVNVRWRSYELDPSTPPEVPGPSVEIIGRKYGLTPEQARAAEARVRETAAAAGLEYHLDRARLGSTFDGHRLVHLARAYGLEAAMKERLFRGRFCDGELIADPNTLVAAGVEVGIPEAEVRATLDSDRFSAEVRADEATARELGITGVPMFVVDRRFAISGAQPPEHLRELLRHGWSERAATPAP
ncbi:DsbA family oxidoreductase [Conexibacter sp. DBS9H8]|uniref:DsbA family oxidoreductase n=1 Tax=Conexibacter sp. DBS9H8 TaxID=2937801 RepID=UPI00200E4C71|nr:DsbA family oxidoreductase [Conexibacter sp. DBS9H8]